MLQAALADLIVVVHMGFVLFVSVGALLVLFRPRLAILHIPCVLYGSALELVGWVCPLTPLEQSLRSQAGQQGYAGGFIEHYVGGLLYPANWATTRVWLGLTLVIFNVVIYSLLAIRIRRNRPAG
ncbi:MAG: DUF2784 domain-containing protein [Gemmatimonadetes bacterium]|nr:DUF2784 domain-containing protein [Gemmatimonadota bacterium]